MSRYRAALESLSRRTNTSLPSLIISFGILHELTAIVPLVAIFYGARSLSIGDRVVESIAASESTSWVTEQARVYVDEGERWAGRVGRRYGIFGYEKRDKTSQEEQLAAPITSTRIAGDVANVVVAYGLTKALLPLRIGFSLWLSPPTSRRVVDPLARLLKRAITLKR